MAIINLKKSHYNKIIFSKKKKLNKWMQMMKNLNIIKFNNNSNYKILIKYNNIILVNNKFNRIFLTKYQ